MNHIRHYLQVFSITIDTVMIERKLHKVEVREWGNILYITTIQCFFFCCQTIWTIYTNEWKNLKKYFLWSSKVKGFVKFAIKYFDSIYLLIYCIFRSGNDENFISPVRPYGQWHLPFVDDDDLIPPFRHGSISHLIPSKRCWQWHLPYERISHYSNIKAIFFFRWEIRFVQ